MTTDAKPGISTAFTQLVYMYVEVGHASWSTVYVLITLHDLSGDVTLLYIGTELTLGQTASGLCASIT